MAMNQLETDRHRELAAFLRSRRARIVPEQVGLPRGMRRRTPGLRRGEVALLAGVTPEWYSRLEQGQDIHVSVQLLESLASVLQLDADERTHLFLLALRQPPPVETLALVTINPTFQQFLQQLDTTPARVIDARLNVVECNTAFQTAIGGYSATMPERESNMIWKTVEESAGICGFDAHKCVKGRKHHILVDTLGLLLAVYVTPADLHDGRGARCLLAGLAPLHPRLKKIWSDAVYRGQELAAWCQAEGSWDIEGVERQPGTRGFSVVPRRWVVERTLSWISRNRRMSKDYERKVQTSETLIQVAMIRLLLARLACKSEPVPKHPMRA